MAHDNEILRMEYTDLEKTVYPEPAEWSSVDFAAGRNQIVIMGYVTNGDRRHSLSVGELDLERSESGYELDVEMRITKRDSDYVFAVDIPGFHYRLLVEFSEEIPGEYSISHVDEHGETQYEVYEVSLSPQRRYFEDPSK